MALTAVLAAFGAGWGLGVVYGQKKRTDGLTEAQLRSLTRLLMLEATRASIVWVSLSYVIALYSTVRLGIVYTLEDLSKAPITVLLVIPMTKVFGNIFEHNDGKVFGTSNKRSVSESDHIEDL